jgi:hypothetical protein
MKNAALLCLLAIVSGLFAQDAGVVTCIQPHLMLRGVISLAAWDRRVIQRRCQPQLLVPTRRFHEAVTLDAIRFRSYAS